MCCFYCLINKRFNDNTTVDNNLFANKIKCPICIIYSVFSIHNGKFNETN